MLLSVAQEAEEETRPPFSPRWVIFATSWSYILVTAYFAYAAIISMTSYHKRCYQQKDSLPVKYKILWFLSSTSLTICSLVVIFYWTLLHDFNRKLKLDLRTYLLIDRHGINLFLLLVEFSVNIIPVQILHFIYPLGFGVLYGIFNITYFFVTGDGAYSFIDWRNNTGQSVAAFIGALVAIIILHIVWYFIYRVKIKFGSSHSRNLIV